MPKRTVSQFLAQDVDTALEKTSKKLSDIFERNDRFQETSGDVHLQRIDWVTLLRDTCEVYTQRHIQKLKASKLTPIWKMYTKSFAKTQKRGGDARLQDLYDALNFLDKKFQRSTQQIEFHKAFIASCLRNIYRDEFSANFLRILQENELQEARQDK